MHSTIRTLCAPAALLLSSLTLQALAGGGANGLTERVLFQTGGAQITIGADVTDMTSDGRYAVVQTYEALVPEDTNAHLDLYRLDLQTGAIEFVSVNSVGGTGNSSSIRGHISEDGRFVVFQTLATNLIVLDNNSDWDVMRKDMLTGALLRVSNTAGGIVAANDGSREPDISADGRYVVFSSRATDISAGVLAGTFHIYRRDMQAGTTTRLTLGLLSEPNDGSYSPKISADGSRVTYQSKASNLVLFDTNGVHDIFVQDIPGAAKLVSRPQGGGIGNDASLMPRISGDGLYVVFTSQASNLTLGDGNGDDDVFRVEVTGGAVELVSALPNGTSGNGSSFVDSISDDGRYVVFGSNVDDLTGQIVAVSSIYIRDLDTHVTSLVSRPTGTTKLPNGVSYSGQVTADGARVVFSSSANNLDQGDTNGGSDVFERTLFADPISYCVSSTTSAGCQPHVGASGIPSASASSGFSVTASNVPNNKIGVFFYSLNGAAQVPILGGTLCVGSLAGRSPVLFSGGNPGVSDCSGSYTIDMNAFAAGLLGGTPHAGLSIIGQQINGQFLGRDPDGVVFKSFFSDAIEYVVGL